MHRYHFSDDFMIGGIDSRLFRCPSCPFEGGEDAMVQHAYDTGHVAVPESKEDAEEVTYHS